MVWGDSVVEYIFSLPTSWDYSPDLTAAYKSVVAKAGFGEVKNCSMKIGLTKAFAAAVYTARKVDHAFAASLSHVHHIMEMLVHDHR